MKKFLIPIFVVLIALVAVSCTDDTSTDDDASNQFQRDEQNATAAQQQEYLNNEGGLPDLGGFSLERDNLENRLVRFNDPDKVSYIYLLTNQGQIIAQSTVKGKVSSVNSGLTNPEQVDWECRGNGGGCSAAVTSSPELDGSYGTNGDAIFWFNDQGIYQEWNGLYLLADEPFELTSQPLLLADVTDVVNGN